MYERLSVWLCVSRYVGRMDACVGHCMCMYIRGPVYMEVCMYMTVCVCMYDSSLYVWMGGLMDVCMYICMYVCMGVCD